jgi:hypothetical protein
VIYLRLLALFAAALVLVAAPMAASTTFSGGMPGAMAAAGMAGLALVAFSFLYIALMGDRMRRPGPARTVGGLLLLIPAAAGAAMLATRTDIALLWGSGVLLSFTVMLFVSFIFPATDDHRHRPMRRRERQEPTLRLIQRHHQVERRFRA